jgi:hypothetical protein
MVRVRSHRDAAASAHAANVCLGVCDYLSRFDAHMQRLSEHCKCSVPSVRRVLYFLRDIGAPLRHIDTETVHGTEHYWRLDRPLIKGEAEVYSTFLFLPQRRAELLMELVRIANNYEGT